MENMNVKAVAQKDTLTISVSISQLSRVADQQGEIPKALFIKCCSKAYDELIKAADAYISPITLELPEGEAEEE